MSIQVGQEVKAVAGMEKGKVGTVLEIGSGAYEGFLKVQYPYWGDAWISAVNGEEATWTEEQVVVEEAKEEVQSVSHILKASELPVFTSGSDAQKKFAQSIRLDCLNMFIGQMERRRQEWSFERYAQLDRVYRSVMCSHASPNFWIDNRARIDEVVFAEIVARIKKEGPVK